MSENNTVRVWDISIRIFHWSLVVAFTTAYITGEVEGDLHGNIGYIVLALLAYRLLWGLVGSRYARFSSFLFGPGETLRYLTDLLGGRAKRYLGHNPAGAVMIYLLLLSLVVTVWTGLELYAVEGKGPLAANATTLVAVASASDEEGKTGEGDDREEFWEELHEFASNISLLLIALHIAGVIVSSRLHKENLVKAMITGRKRA
jgi:cytochrome b